MGPISKADVVNCDQFVTNQPPAADLFKCNSFCFGPNSWAFGMAHKLRFWDGSRFQNSAFHLAHKGRVPRKTRKSLVWSNLYFGKVLHEHHSRTPKTCFTRGPIPRCRIKQKWWVNFFLVKKDQNRGGGLRGVWQKTRLLHFFLGPLPYVVFHKSITW